MYCERTLALPGWFVDRQGRGEVMVISGREVYRLLGGQLMLNPAMQKRIAHQLDGLCRDVEF